MVGFAADRDREALRRWAASSARSVTVLVCMWWGHQKWKPCSVACLVRLNYFDNYFDWPSFDVQASLTKPSQDQRGMCRPSGTSSTESWYCAMVVVVAQLK